MFKLINEFFISHNKLIFIILHVTLHIELYRKCNMLTTNLIKCILNVATVLYFKNF